MLSLNMGLEQGLNISYRPSEKALRLLWMGCTTSVPETTITQLCTNYMGPLPMVSTGSPSFPEALNVYHLTYHDLYP